MEAGEVEGEGRAGWVGQGWTGDIPSPPKPLTVNYR